MGTADVVVSPAGPVDESTSAAGHSGRVPTLDAASDLFAQLRREPDVEAPELVAVDATDRLLLDDVLARAHAQALAGETHPAVREALAGWPSVREALGAAR